MAISKIILNGVTQMDVTQKTVTSASMLDGVTALKNDGTNVTGSIESKTASDLTASGATVTAPAGYYSAAASKSVTTMTLPTSAASSATSGYTSKATIGRSTATQYINIPPGYNSAGAYYVISAVANGSATAPASISGTAASVSTGTNTLTLTKTVSVTPTVSAGYVSSGTAGNSSVSLTASVSIRSSSDLTVSGDTVTAPAGYYAASASKAVASGTAGTPTATKGTVSNHSISVTPSVTNTTGYISGSTKTGTAVTVTASELASGNKAIIENGTNIDVVGYSTVSVAVPTGPTYTATLTSSGGSGNTYVAFNSINYYTSGDTFTYHAGDTLVVIACGTRAGGTIKIDGVTVAFDQSNRVSYNYTLPASDISIAMSYSSAGEVDITTLSDAPTIQSLTVTPSASQQTFNSSSVDGYKPVTVAGDADLVGSNILSTANIFGVQGTVVVQNYYTGSSAPSSSTGSNGDLYLQT